MDKILIIEDNMEIRDNLEEYLLLCDFEVITAVNGEEGIKSVYEHLPNFIICDISMPIKNGYEVFSEIKPFIATNNIPFMFLTASAQQKDLAQGKATGADAYVVKPYDSENLLSLIRELLSKKKTSHDTNHT